jgi:hypothetical protein
MRARTGGSASTRLLAAIVMSLAVIAPASSQVKRQVLASPLVEEGSDPDGCTPVASGEGGPVAWVVRVERLLLDGKALVETSGGREVDRFPMCIADRPVARNLAIELAFVPRQGRVARAAGIVFRFIDPNDYYVVRADALANDVRMTRVVNGERADVAVRAVQVASDASHALKVEALDDRFTAWFDGKRLFEARDRRLGTAGRIGIWSRSDSVTSFGDLFFTLRD